MTGGSRASAPADPRVLRGAPPVPTPPQRHPRRDRATPRLPPCVSRPLDQVGCHASRSIRARICPKRRDVKWLSANGSRQWSRARIGEGSLDQGAQAEPLVQLAGRQQPGIQGHRGAPELNAELGVEREGTQARCRVTHRVEPSEPARSLGGRGFSRQLSHATSLRSPVISEIRVKPPHPALSPEGRGNSDPLSPYWRDGDKVRT